MQSIFMTIYFFIILILEIYFLIIAVKQKNKKYFKIVSGLFWGFFISNFIYYIYYISELYSYDTGEWIALGELIKSILLCIINIIIGFISLIFNIYFKKKKYLTDTTKKGITIKYILLVSIISFIIVFGQFLIKNNEKIKSDNEVKKETMVYLKEKYGNNNFKIIDIDRDFGANGFVGTDHLENYDIEAIYVPDNIKFYITLDVDNSRKIQKDSSSDNLLANYYKTYFKNDDFIEAANKEKAKLTDYLRSKKLNIEIKGNNFFDYIAYDIVPNNGNIPSKEELYDLILNYYISHEYQIIINDVMPSVNVELEMKEYLIKLSRYIVEYYPDLNEYELECKYNDRKNKYFYGSINIDEYYINIKVGSIKEKIKR